MERHPKSKGYMDGSYAIGRKTRPALAYRYQVRALEAAEAIKRNLNPLRPLKVLDLGSADGLSLQEMALLLPAGTAFTGVEYSSQLVSLASRLGPGIRVVQGDMASLAATVGPDLFDIVTALAVLEHSAAPAIALKQAAGALKSGGLVVATCPEPFWDRVATRLGLLEDHHESYLSRRLMAACMEQAGLEIIDYRRFMWAPVGILPYLGIRVSPALSLKMDAVVRRIRVLDWLFINQLWVAHKL